jgi:phosphatidylinositol phospholipase C delta
MRGRDLEIYPTPFQLPDSIVSRKTSSNSLAQSGSLHSPAMVSQESSKGASGIMRRLSTKVAGLGSSARRQSSVHPISRDGSVGPSVIRNRLRSNSNSSALIPLEPAFYSDSDDELLYEKDDCSSTLFSDGSSLRDLPTLSATASLAESNPPNAFTAGPVIPLSLVSGTWVWKLSKQKKKPKKIFLVLDTDGAKIYWDKTRPSKSVYLDDIKQIRTGDDLGFNRSDFNNQEIREGFSFSLIVATHERSGQRTIHLVAKDESTLKAWTTTIEAISKHRQDFATSLMAFNDKAVRSYWANEIAKMSEDRPHSPAEESIDFPGVERVCRNLHIHVSSSTLLDKFNEVKTAGKGGRDPSRLNFEGFLEFVRLMKTRKDIRAVYREFASDTEAGLTREDFLTFLRESQAEAVDEDLPSWEATFVRFARKGRAKDIINGSDETLRMSELGLAGFLTSTSNPALVREPRSYALDRPMNEYYISSSHNTYLLGRQVAGVASVEGYVEALMRGCRCVEVDCWDGQKLNEPVVVHGRTLSTEIPFRDVIHTINKYAFVKSQFPLWISLEVRCNFAMQEKMAQIMLDIFGEKLVLQPLDPDSDRLPSPSQLKGRILIKVKKPQQVEEPRTLEVIGRRRGNSLSSPLQRPINGDTGSIPGSPLLSPMVNGARKVSSRIHPIAEGQVQDRPSSNPSEGESDSDKDSAHKSLNKINPLLGGMGVYSAGIQFEGFETAEAKTYNHIFSFKEKTFAKNSQPGEKKRALFRHNMRYMMRVYPNATRINSSNFDPLIYWKRGVQMCALNWQTFDLGMQLNHAMFDSGADRSGYVLKPLGFREFQVMPNGSGEWATKRERKNVSFSIDVISAQQLMKPFNLGDKRTVDPYVEVEVFLADDKRNKIDANGNSVESQGPRKFRTSIIRGNGFNPEFDNKFNFNFTTKYPDLIFVRWSVKLAEKTYNDRLPPLATFTAKLTSLKQGYRTLPLLNDQGDQYLFSTLFCRIKVDITSVLVPAPDEDLDNANKFRGIRGPFFNRANNNLSPKSSLDSGQS